MKRPSSPARASATAREPDLVSLTLALFNDTAEAVRLLTRQVQDGDFGKLDALTREQANLRKALLLAMQEREQAERIRREQHGGNSDGLDLAAARAEIGRRLARLRGAGNP